MYSRNFVKKILVDLAHRKISINSACKKLGELPYKDLGFAKIDNHRKLRRGFSEVIYCKGKTHQQVEKILESILPTKDGMLLTYANRALYKALKKRFLNIEHNEAAKIIFIRPKKLRKKGKVIIVTAGTSDFPIAEQARITLDVMGNRVKSLNDVGVAVLHRLFDKLSLLKSAKVIIVIAGMEGALASVVSGLVSKPVIAVPTSVGYGSSFKGVAPLLTMLNSCSPGIGVVNIDNGFGAGYLASLINK